MQTRTDDHRTTALRRAAIAVLLFCVALTGGCFEFDFNAGWIDLESSEPADRPDDLYAREGESLVLSVPYDLDASLADIEGIYNYALLVAHCRTTSGAPVPISLAEACILYDIYYLFPENFPGNLDAFSDVAGYVDFVGRNDPFTFYYPPEIFSSFQSLREGDSAHIGFRYRFEGEVISEETPFQIQEVYPFTRAWIDGLQEGDRIIRIDDTDISGLTIEEAGDLLPDQEAESVTITVERNGAEVTVATGAEEHIALILSPGIAYFSVRSFTLATGTRVKKDYQALVRQSALPITGVILDLRDNPGGSTVGALALTDYLIDQDTPANARPIMIVDGTFYQNDVRYLGNYDAENIGDYSQTSFVVLVDEFSASASEVTTAALQYYDEATVIGNRTFGKGVSQFVFELIDGSGVWITSHYIYTPDRSSFNGVGISPDVPVTETPVSFSEDPALETALQFLQTGEAAQLETDRRLLSRPVTTAAREDPYLGRIAERGKDWR